MWGIQKVLQLDHKE